MQMVKHIIAITLMATVAMGADRYSRDKEIVTDNETGLQWQDDSEAKTIRKTWEEAITHCEQLALDRGGWRLPSINELESLIDYGRYDPAIDQELYLKMSIVIFIGHLRVRLIIVVMCGLSVSTMAVRVTALRIGVVSSVVCVKIP